MSLLSPHRRQLGILMALSEKGKIHMSDKQLLDLLKSDPECPVCGQKGVAASDDKGIRYDHPGRVVPCRVTPKALLRS